MKRAVAKATAFSSSSQESPAPVKKGSLQRNAKEAFMAEQYTINYHDDGNGAGHSAPALPVQQHNPNMAIMMPPRRRRVPAVVQAALVSVTTAGLFIAMEVLAPVAAKPSTWLGSYNGRLVAETSAHQLETHAKYEAWAKRVELSVAQQNEAYRTNLQAIGVSYQMAHERARMFADATARIQQDYLHQRMAQTQSTQSGDLAVINLARIFGDLAVFIDPNAAQTAHAYADTISDRLKKELDEAVQTGVTVEVDGWDLNLPSPAEVTAKINAVPPLKIPPLPEISRDATAKE